MTDWIANPLTNRYIKKYGNTYKTLVRSGIIKEEVTGFYSDKEEEETEFYTDNEEEETEFYTDNEVSVSESDKEADKEDNTKGDGFYTDNELDESDKEEEEKYETDEYESDKEDKNTLPNDIDVDNMTDKELDKLYQLLINIKK